MHKIQTEESDVDSYDTIILRLYSMEISKSITDFESDVTSLGRYAFKLNCTMNCTSFNCF